MHPHLLGIDDGPFDRHRDADVPLVGVMMEGPDLVEGVAITRFPVDGFGVTDVLASWITSQRWHATLQGVVLGGITLAGLAVVDVQELAERLTRPVFVVTRHDTRTSTLADALRSAGFLERLPLLERTPPARRLRDGLFLAAAGTDAVRARRLILAACGKANLPEALRVAHLVASALVRGSSYGRA